MKKGIDVSEFQGIINWDEVKNSGIEFAILRAGYGQNNIDNKFRRNIEECKRVGIPIGIYWFSYALNENMAKAEARYAVQAVKGYELEYPIAYDFEQASVDYCENNGINVTREFATKLVLAFCNEIKSQGYYPINYANLDFLNNMFNMQQLKDIDIWYAYYNEYCNKTNICSMWQYSDSGQVNGINGQSVDMDYDFVDYPNIIKSAINKGDKDKVKNIVVYDNEIDERAAGYLADYLQCPTISNNRKFNYSCVENVYAVGGKKEYYTSYLKVLISGENRFDTMQKVLNFINK